MGGYCSTAFSRKFEGGSRVHDLHHAKYHRTREELDLNRILYYYKVVLEGRNYSAQSNSLNKEPVDLQEELLMFLFSLSEVARLPSLCSSRAGCAPPRPLSFLKRSSQRTSNSPKSIQSRCAPPNSRQMDDYQVPHAANGEINTCPDCLPIFANQFLTIPRGGCQHSPEQVRGLSSELLKHVSTGLPVWGPASKTADVQYPEADISPSSSFFQVLALLIAIFDIYYYYLTHATYTCPPCP